ncbi:Lar family restriction alleviation protein [Burkholderia gladioli]|uniref:Lar family restriction alleviation protein n=1 Tax=Burkholderia gladioli TaxID=28095 RepID=UPI001640C9DB|nr:Lar family restriction alleviation protein [Burkholderia gladioli]
MSDKLSDCPFCGNEAETEKIEEGCYGVGCGYCDFQLMSGNIGIGWHKSEAAAIAAWNRRASPAPAISESEDAALIPMPAKPDDAMQLAGAMAIRFETTPINKIWTANAVYRAMVAARKGEKS